MNARARAVFRGKVQGVFFRDNTKRKADELGVLGWVRNMPDGTVEAIFEGEKAEVAEVIRWCSLEQPRATVERAEVEWTKYQSEFNRFEVRE